MSRRPARPYPFCFVLAVAFVACRKEAPPEPEQIDVRRSLLTLPAGFADALVATVASPTAVAFTPDGRMLITTQGGALRIVQSGTLLGTAALDLSARLCTNIERGLLGIAVDPQFATNNFIYLFYTWKKHGVCVTNQATAPVNRVSRFTLGPNNLVSTSSELVLIDNIPSPAGNHNGGDVHFGQDGLLYVSVGDGGCSPLDASKCAGSNDIARSKSTLLGKILRVSPDGTIPSTNPEAATTGSRRCGDPAGVPSGGGPCKEMFAWGLRNPFRIAFRPGSNDFFINDVGQGVWEEIDQGVRGADYGWNVREGFCANGSTSNCGAPPSGMTNPIFAYKHGSNPAPSPFQNCNSITGGAFVPGGAWPTAFEGAYLFSDYVCGKIFQLSPNGTGGWTATEFASGLGGSSAVALRFGPSGGTQALYYTTYANGGQVRRISFTGSTNRPPTAALSASPTSGSPPLAVTFNGSGSADPDGDALTYLWDFGDGTNAQTTTATTSHTYSGSGTYAAKLVVRDSRGASSAAAGVTISTNNTPPVPQITSPTSTQRFRVGETITLSGSATDAQDGTLPASALSWRVLLHHDTHTHPFFGPSSGSGLTFTAPAPEDLLAATNSYLMVQLTATDSAGASATIAQRLDPKVVNVTFATNPAGLRLTVNGTNVTGPTTVTSWEGYALTVTAPPQALGTTRYAFASWADGGAARRTIVTPAAATTYTANFTTTLEFKVNFQPAGAATPAGYLADTGGTFGDRANGFAYGWNADNAAQTRDRNAATDQRYDTLTHLQKPGNPDARWDFELPNGSYQVRVVAGDPSYFDSVFRLTAEGTLILSGTPTTGTRWVEATGTVSVSDGRLSIGNGAGASNNKIAFIEIRGI